MPLCITADQKAFFDKNGHIEFADVIKQEVLDSLKTCAIGRDIARHSPILQKVAYGPAYAKIAAELTGQNYLRYGFDEIFELPGDKTGSFTLHERSSIQPLVVALVICLEGTSLREPNQSTNGCVTLPVHPGHAVFIKPSLLWNYEELNTFSKQKFLLITYANLQSMYILEERDTATHALKQLGYIFGDKLRESTHPVVYGRCY